MLHRARRHEAVALEEQVRLADQQIELARRAAHIGSFDWHVATGRMTWNREEERIFGLEPGTFEGTLPGWARRVLPAGLPRVQREVHRAMARGDASLDLTFRLVRPGGDVRWLESSGRFVYDSAGTPLHLVGVNIDVTDLERAEQGLREREEQLRLASPRAIA